MVDESSPSVPAPVSVRIAGVLVGVVPRGNKAGGTVEAGEHDLAMRTDGQREEFVAGVVVERGAEGIAAASEGFPECEQRFGTGCGAAGKYRAVIGEDGVNPGIEGKKRRDGLTADPVDLRSLLMESIDSRDGHEDVANGTEFDDESADHLN